MKIQNKNSDEKIKYLIRKDKNEISNSITRNWTEQALRCYLSKCNCTDCTVTKGNYSFVCQMPAIIQILLEDVGPPKQNKIRKIIA